MRDAYNVARVDVQWADPEDDLDVAVACCPKDCIHTVPKADLPLLEWIHASQPRQRVTLCSVESMSGRGKGLEESPFVAAERSNEGERRCCETQPPTPTVDARENARRRRSRASTTSWACRDGSEENRTTTKTPRRRPEARRPLCPLPEVFVNRALLALPGYRGERVEKEAEAA